MAKWTGGFGTPEPQTTADAREQQESVGKHAWMENSERTGQGEHVRQRLRQQPETLTVAREQGKQSKGEVRPYAEPEMVSTGLSAFSLETLQTNLANSLSIINDEVMKGYVTRLSDMELIMPDETALAKLEKMQFFHITELVYEKDEFAVHKLSTVMHTLSQKPCTIALMICSDGSTNSFYLGVRSREKTASTATMRNMLQNSLLALFPGSRIEPFLSDELESVVESVSERAESVSGVTCVADYKRNDQTVHNDDFIQGLEKFVHSMDGQRYTAVVIADSVDRAQLEFYKREYEGIYSQISPFVNMQINFSENASESRGVSSSRGTMTSSNYGINEGTNLSHSTSKADTSGTSRTMTASDTEGTNRSLSKGTTDTTSVTDGTSVTDTKTNTRGFNAGINIGNGGRNGRGNSGKGILGMVGVNAGINVSRSFSTADGRSHSDSRSHAISETLTHGLSSSHTQSASDGISASRTKTDGITEGESRGYNYSIGEALNIVNGDSYTDTFGSSKAVTLNAKNMTLQAELDRLEKQLQRISESESIGMWSCAAYFLGDIPAVTDTAANVYYSIMSGDRSGTEASGVHSWKQYREDSDRRISVLKQYILNFVHPKFVYRGFGYEGERVSAVEPSALVSTNELALHMGLPRHSVKGLPVVEHAQFAQEVVTHQQEGKKRGIRLGNVYHFGKATETGLLLDRNSLTMHTFITGSTGSGKSNTVYGLLGELRRRDVSFLVVEPAKGEYKDVLGKYHDVMVYGTNPNMSDYSLLRINPFRFPVHTHILEHLDRLIEIFNVCWPMYAAMPAILKDSVERAYVRCGWDLERSVNRYGVNLFPSFRDIVEQVKYVLNESDYSDDNKGDYTGSLVTRLRSLTNGINGMIFAPDDISDEELFDKNVIVDLSRVGAMETKSLIMGLLVLKLQEHRMEQRSIGTKANEGLRHITVLEEAHNLLKRTSTEQSGEGANLLGKSVEMLANSIAEMRTYGEGFVIADQSPGLLDMSAIRNTNTKIILRLPDLEDRELVGKAAGLNESQVVELAKLERGVAAISQNDWLEPVLCKVDKFDEERVVFRQGEPKPIRRAIDNKVVSRSLLDKIMSGSIYRDEDKETLQKLKEDIIRSNLDSSVKCSFLDYLEEEPGKNMDSLRALIYDFLNAGEAIENACRYRDISEWVHAVADQLEPDITQYSRQQIDIVMGILIYEQSIRDGRYRDLLSRYTQIYKTEGGVF